ncbi:MAG: DUF362 domain-containing protein [Promethearchaeota archaeon]|jgi:hypothetical protein
MRLSRRDFIRYGTMIAGTVTGISKSENAFGQHRSKDHAVSEALSHIYMSKNGTPEQNVTKVIEMMGGIEKIIDKEDIVIIKPNAQSSGHAMTNTNALKGFMDLVLGIPGYKGEIIIAENHHYYPDNSRGWTTKNPNGDYNLNDLIILFNENDHKNITKYHWRDGGPNPHPVHGNAANWGVVTSPEEGDGYVWSDEEYVFNGLKTKMTYPIFTSSFSGLTIDLKNGAWRDSKYTDQPVKLINFSALNHHGNAGVTASIKNYMGIVDLSSGFHGSSPPGYYNFHYIGAPWPPTEVLKQLTKKMLISPILKKEKYISKLISFVGPMTGALGGAIGHFMNTIRKADLNIITAEYVGHESRWRNPFQNKTVMSSVDPVALDYYASKYIVLPLGGKKAYKHNPDDKNTTLRKILDFCHKQGIGTLHEDHMVIDDHIFA